MSDHERSEMPCMECGAPDGCQDDIELAEAVLSKLVGPDGWFFLAEEHDQNWDGSYRFNLDRVVSLTADEAAYLRQLRKEADAPTD